MRSMTNNSLQDFRTVKTGFVPEPVMQQLRILVKSVCFRRTKTSKIDGEPILQLPPKVIEKVHVVFDERERDIYDALNSKTQAQIERLLNAGILGKNYSHVLVLLLRLRQACCHPQLMQAIKTEMAAVEGRDLIANAKLLSSTVVDRIKNNEGGEDEGTCPICMDIVENAVIYIPCGHSVCNECFARISDPQILARDNDTGMIKCQNCRGPVDPLKITDAESFKKAYDPAASTESSAAAVEDDPSDDSDSDEWDSDTDTDGSSDRSKKKSLAELRKEGQKNKRAKRRYLRRLEKSWVPSAKIAKAVEILGDNEARGNGEKTIIFSQFTSLLDLLEIPINRKGWKYCRFDGSMNITERNESVATFTDDPDVKIMLVSLKAGNAGLNLIAASHVILFDPFWNPYVEDQAIDRAHRIGQLKDVFVHRLLIENTVEDRIIHLQEQKRELISGALDEGGSMNVSRLDVRELAYLFVSLITSLADMSAQLHPLETLLLTTFIHVGRSFLGDTADDQDTIHGGLPLATKLRFASLL
jgi:SNF2 family DNA or RNA helicase